MVSEYSLLSKVLGQHQADEFDTLTLRMVSEYSLTSKVLGQHQAGEFDTLTLRMAHGYSLISNEPRHSAIVIPTSTHPHLVKMVPKYWLASKMRGKNYTTQINMSQELKFIE